MCALWASTFKSGIILSVAISTNPIKKYVLPFCKSLNPSLHIFLTFMQTKINRILEYFLHVILLPPPVRLWGVVALWGISARQDHIYQLMRRGFFCWQRKFSGLWRFRIFILLWIAPVSMCNIQSLFQLVCQRHWPIRMDIWSISMNTHYFQVFHQMLPS